MLGVLGVVGAGDSGVCAGVSGTVDFPTVGEQDAAIKATNPIIKNVLIIFFIICSEIDFFLILTVYQFERSVAIHILKIYILKNTFLLQFYALFYI